MQKSPQKMASDKEFEAPDWVRDDSQTPPITEKQKGFLKISLFIFVPFCLWAGWFEFGRAQSGNWRAWVYTFEWPFFAATSFYMWRRISKGEIPRIPRPNLRDLDGKDGQ